MVSLGLAMMKGKEMADEQYKRNAERAEWHRDAGLRAKRSKAEEAKLDDELSPERQKMLEMARQMEFKVSQNMTILDKHRGRMETDPTAFADALNETHPQADGSKWVVDDKDGYANGLTLKRVAPDGTVLQDSGKMFSNVTSGEHALMALQGAVQKPLEQIKDIAGRRTAAAERAYKAWEKQGDWTTEAAKARLSYDQAVKVAGINAATAQHGYNMLFQSNMIGKLPDLQRAITTSVAQKYGVTPKSDGSWVKADGTPLAADDPIMGTISQGVGVMFNNMAVNMAQGKPVWNAFSGMGMPGVAGPAGAPGTPAVSATGIPNIGFTGNMQPEFGWGSPDYSLGLNEALAPQIPLDSALTDALNNWAAPTTAGMPTSRQQAVGFVPGNTGPMIPGTNLGDVLMGGRSFTFNPSGYMQ